MAEMAEIQGETPETRSTHDRSSIERCTSSNLRFSKDSTFPQLLLPIGYAEHFTDPSIAHHLLLVPFPYSKSDADWWVQKREEDAKDPESYFAVRRSDGFLVGAIGTEYSAARNGHCAEIGYWLSSRYRGRNLMPAVIQAFALHCFGRLQVHRLEAKVFSFNDASSRALTKAGFSREGLLRDFHSKDGKYIDAVLFSLLSTDVVPDITVKPDKGADLPRL